jgi:hypothetical protein
MTVIHLLILALKQICKNNYYFRKLFSFNLYKDVFNFKDFFINY